MIIANKNVFGNDLELVSRIKQNKINKNNIASQFLLLSFL